MHVTHLEVLHRPAQHSEAIEVSIGGLPALDGRRTDHARARSGGLPNDTVCYGLVNPWQERQPLQNETLNRNRDVCQFAWCFMIATPVSTTIRPRFIFPPCLTLATAELPQKEPAASRTPWGLGLRKSYSKRTCLQIYLSPVCMCSKSDRQTASRTDGTTYIFLQYMCYA